MRPHAHDHANDHSGDPQPPTQPPDPLPSQQPQASLSHALQSPQPNAIAECDAMLTLNMAPGLGPILTTRAIKQMGSATRLLQASVADLQQIQGIGQDKAATIRRGLDQLSDGRQLAQEKNIMADLGAHALVLGQPDYPKLLTLTPDPPLALYVRGQILQQDAVALGVVGSRKCTAYGREQADRLCTWCAQAGLTIVSGGAYGIDAAAHRAAMRAGGRTIIVLGSGLARPYPQEHIELFDQAAAQGHAVISEFPMTAPPRAEQFPRRNRIISGLSLGVLVIEAALRSGALITARLAAEDHGREVLALPGRVDSPASAGCHKILRDGWATLVTSGPEVLEALGEAGQILQSQLPTEYGAAFGTGPSKNQSSSAAGGSANTSSPSLFEQNLSEAQQKIVAALDKPLELDQLAAVTRLPIAKLQAELTMLQIRSVVKRESGKIMRTR